MPILYPASEEFDKVTGVDYYLTKKGYIILRALDNKLRQKIISLLHKHKKLTGEEIYGKLKIDQATASQQLKILILAKMVRTTQHGRYIHYSINYYQLKKVNRLVKKFAEIGI